MKSIRHGNVGANTKLRGKITLILSCGCCDMRNFKWPERWKSAAKEIRAEARARQTGV